MTRLEPGLAATVRQVVGEDDTAEAVGSGDVPVLATPVVLTLVERAAVAAVAPHLDPGTTTVGARVGLDHLAPSRIGVRVSATARLDSVEGRRLKFSFEVSDGRGVVARGIHYRVVVGRNAFLEQSGPGA
ncbi:MAG TPA: hotdog domain-containing protein [Actinomycetota bacterium]|jgi:fluoroacetyl-CoA thioesterase|nr:hotdog domain-containing protein [Actinomycetota bacterium]